MLFLYLEWPFEVQRCKSRWRIWKRNCGYRCFFTWCQISKQKDQSWFDKNSNAVWSEERSWEGQEMHWGRSTSCYRSFLFWFEMIRRLILGLHCSNHEDPQTTSTQWTDFRGNAWFLNFSVSQQMLVVVILLYFCFRCSHSSHHGSLLM